MRLLQVTDDGDVKLTNFQQSFPLYAILSHTWGQEEVSYNDILKSDGKEKGKIGYEKIRFCAGQAARDGLKYIWVDTCCINKSSDAELSEALNSMYRWYKEAAKCYVYLSDVWILDESGSKLSKETLNAAVRSSRWFTRGWTLQELLAPTSVDFFSREGERLGDRHSLETQICEITGIPVQALRGDDLSGFNVSERMAWLDKRETTRPEDLAYCMLGIFNVMMPVQYGEGKERAMIRLQIVIDEFKLQEKQNGRLVPFVVPFEPNSNFVGRKDELDSIMSKLIRNDRTTRLAIVGLGGVGKTQLALQVAHHTRNRDPQCLVLWIQMTSMDSCDQGFREAAIQLGLPGIEDQKVDCMHLLSVYLSKEDAGRWLLIFDNADDIDMWTVRRADEPGSKTLEQMLPKSRHGCIVFTTRDRRVAAKLATENVTELTEMSEGVARELLRKRLIRPGLLDDQEVANTLLDRLTYLPLAIVQATAYINENGIDLADYLALLNEQDDEVIELLGEDFDDDGRYAEVQNPVATTWLVSFEQIRRRHPLAADYLSFMACVSPRNIPQTLLPPGDSRKQELEAVGTLTAYSFVARQAAPASLDMHRLVHLTIRSWLQREGDLQRWQSRAMARLESVLPLNDYADGAHWRRYIPHAAYMLNDPTATVDRYASSRAGLERKYGMCHRNDGHYEIAERALRAVVQRERESYGEDHATRLRELDDLTIVLLDRGKLHEAEALLRQVIAEGERVLGVHHEDTLYRLSNLSLVLEWQSKYDEAEMMLRQTLVTCERRLGFDHRQTLTSMASLVTVLKSQFKWAEAETLCLRALAGYERIDGADHPETLRVMGDLALLLSEGGKAAEGEVMQRQVLAKRKAIDGVDHPATLICMSNLAYALYRQLKFDEAEALWKLVIAKQKVLLGEDHLNTMASIENLARMLCRQGKLGEAETMLREILAKLETVLGANHPKTLEGLASLADVLAKSDRQGEAQALYKRACDGLATALGANHPRTLSTREIFEYWLAKWSEGRNGETVLQEAEETATEHSE